MPSHEAREVPEILDQLLDLGVQPVDVALSFHASVGGTVLLPARLAFATPLGAAVRG
jgi:hypothetical protein